MSFDPQRGMGEIRAEDGRIFSVHRTGLDDAAELQSGEAVTFLDDGGRWPRARAVRVRQTAARPAPGRAPDDR